MTKKLIGAFTLALLFQWSNASEPTPLEATVVVGSAQIGIVNETSCAFGETGAKLKRGDTVIVIRTVPCTAAAGHPKKDFVKVAHQGKLGELALESLSFPNGGRETLSVVAKEDQERADEAGRSASKVIAEAQERILEAQKRIALDALNKELEKIRRAGGVGLMEYGRYNRNGLRFTVVNLTNKPIKYVNVTVIGLNAVNDPVITPRGLSSVSVRGVGPIAPEENATYAFDYVWYGDLVHSVRMNSMIVEFMDGTSRTVVPSKIQLSDDAVRALKK